MIKSHKQLKNKHINSDIYVVGSGASLNHIDKTFFDNKIVIGINRVVKSVPCNYIVSKDARGFKELHDFMGNAEVVISKGESGQLQQPNKPNFDCYIFDHVPFAGPNCLPNLSIIGSDNIVISYSTITSGIHLAAYMGAKNIILVGHDCGSIDGELTVKNYYDKISPVQGSLAGYEKWLTQYIEQHTIDLKKKLTEHYNCNIVSINPFINLGLEGHVYKK